MKKKSKTGKSRQSRKKKHNQLWFVLKNKHNRLFIVFNNIIDYASINTHNIIDYARKKEGNRLCIMDNRLCTIFMVNRLWIICFHMVNRLYIVVYVKHTTCVKM